MSKNRNSAAALVVSLKNVLIAIACGWGLLCIIERGNASSDSGFTLDNEEEYVASLPEKPRMSDEEWARIAGESTEQRYIIQPGDSLWDICTKFLDSPYYWPKLWELNHGTISNPHQLIVGSEIRFLAGSGTALPSVEVGPEPVKPEFRDQSFDVLPAQKARKDEYDDLGFQKNLVTAKKVRDRIRPHGFVVKEEVPNYGEIVGSTLPRTYFSNRDIIYIDLENNSGVTEGSNYSIYKYEGNVLDPDSLLGFALGRWVRILGEVKILDIKSNKARAEVIRAFEDVVRGNFITKLYPNVDGLSARYLDIDLKGDIVQMSEPDKVFDGLGSVVFINRGERDGVVPGTVFDVIQSRDGLTESEKFVRPEIKGRLMAFHVESHSASCIVLKSTQELYIGDVILAARK